MKLKKHICFLLACLMVGFFASCSRIHQNENDEIYYGNSQTDNSLTDNETVNYTIEENKVISDDFSFYLPEGYEINGNGNGINAESKASEMKIAIDSYTDEHITLEEYLTKRKTDISKTGYEISEPREIEVNNIVFTELRVGMPGRSETAPIGCEYIFKGEKGIISVTTYGNGFGSIDTTKSEELVEQLNLYIN